MKKTKLRILTNISMLIAIGIVLAEVVQISYPPGSSAFIRFSLGYLTIILVSLLYGPVYGVIAGAIQDILGFYVATLLSSFIPWVSAPGAFFVGYTINAMMYGLIPGFLFRKAYRNEERFYEILSFILSGAMLIASVWFLFDVDLIRASYLNATEKTVIAAISVAISLLMNLINFLMLRRPPQRRPSFKLMFTLTLLYIITSLILTPIWIVYFYLGTFSAVPHVSYWVLLPIRIIKMPIDLLLYGAILPRIYSVVKSVSGGEEEVASSPIL